MIDVDVLRSPGNRSMLRDYDSTSISVLPSNQATYPYSLHSVQAVSSLMKVTNRFRANIVIIRYTSRNT